jgi:O-acetyl-ADP-ribose deacetylase (regulator of RNase III)
MQSRRPPSISHVFTSKHVIHTVGPVYAASKVETKASQLASCYRRSLELATESSLRHVVRRSSTPPPSQILNSESFD